jgi:hypothetical protein
MLVARIWPGARTGGPIVFQRNVFSLEFRESLDPYTSRTIFAIEMRRPDGWIGMYSTVLQGLLAR